MIEDLYIYDGKRLDYGELPADRQAMVKSEKKRIAKEVYEIVKDKKVKQVIDNEQPIEICFTKKGVKHFCNDALLLLSGKYFSEDEMKLINYILEKAEYLESYHSLKHLRSDGRDLWFTYKDKEGRGVYFKVSWSRYTKQYELYSVVEKI